MKTLKEKRDYYLNRLEKKHNNFYTYEFAIFNSHSDNLTVSCPKHGEFEQNLGVHLSGSGCSECAKDKSRKHNIVLKSDYIKRANLVHNDKFDYSKINYTTLSDYITIICPKHGEFEQLAGGHLNGKYGCNKCRIAESGTGLWTRKKYKDRVTILYYIKVNNLYKIGLTMSSVKKRFRADIKQGVEIDIIKEWVYPDGSFAHDKEQEIINKYKEYKYLGEKIINAGNSELFVKDVLHLNNKIK